MTNVRMMKKVILQDKWLPQKVTTERQNLWRQHQRIKKEKSCMFRFLVRRPAVGFLQPSQSQWKNLGWVWWKMEGRYHWSLWCRYWPSTPANGTYPDLWCGKINEKNPHLVIPSWDSNPDHPSAKWTRNALGHNADQWMQMYKGFCMLCARLKLGVKLLVQMCKL